MRTDQEINKQLAVVRQAERISFAIGILSIIGFAQVLEFAVESRVICWSVAAVAGVLFWYGFSIVKQRFFPMPTHEELCKVWKGPR